MIYLFKMIVIDLAVRYVRLPWGQTVDNLQRGEQPGNTDEHVQSTVHQSTDIWRFPEMGIPSGNLT